MTDTTLSRAAILSALRSGGDYPQAAADMIEQLEGEVERLTEALDSIWMLGTDMPPAWNDLESWQRQMIRTLQGMALKAAKTPESGRDGGAG